MRFLSLLIPFTHTTIVLASSYSEPIAIHSCLPANASAPVLEAFVSFSIELAFFPDFAGNLSTPNIFSDNLLNNLGNLTGTKPYIRVGGNTQDYALYNASLPVAINGIYNLSRSADYPTTLFIGPSFFESYATWPNTLFSHGFNLGNNQSIGQDTLLATVPLACKALENGKLYNWELGNEPDLYSTSSQGPVRLPTWNESLYVSEWLNGTKTIKRLLADVCPNMTTPQNYGYLAPSFAGTNNHLNAVVTWHDDLDVDKDIRLISSHNYIGGATQPGVTLQGTLMNHSSTVASIAPQLNESRLLANYSIPFILGETNSLYNEGAPGLSNAFGAALWGVDFNLWCASQGIRRTHMHMGTDYRYASWQPINTNKTTMGTKPPYYGNIAVAAMMGNITAANVSIVNIPQSSIYDASYAAYVNDKLARIAVINMREYNYTTNGSAPSARSSSSYSFSLPAGYGSQVTVQRLIANGSDAISGITFDGYSYNYELDNGKPVLLKNVTRGETLGIWGDVVSVDVPDSSAAILHIK
ncbi:hypothetical protein MMC26_001361 [Xylographa opegraphella]|nr:hypothetical protein [Xylographa opegraphella]